jgi:hypothetical protein
MLSKSYSRVLVQNLYCNFHELICENCGKCADGSYEERTYTDGEKNGDARLVSVSGDIFTFHYKVQYLHFLAVEFSYQTAIHTVCFHSLEIA